MKNLTGKVALVTGGSRGLGVAIATTLAERGADVVITYNQAAKKAESVVKNLKGKGVRAIAVKSDQGDLSAAETLIQKVLFEFGKLDILVNNAAIALQGNLIDDPEIDNEAMNRQWMVNALGVVATIRAASKVLPDGGRIISIGSGLGTRVGIPGVTDYAATKAAIVGYTKGAARDLGKRNITVNVVQPGVMLTDMAAALEGKIPPQLLAMHAIAGTADINDVAAMVAFLAEPQAGFITGAILDINGGWTA